MNKFIGASVFVAAMFIGSSAFAMSGGFYQVCRDYLCLSHPNVTESVPMHQGEIFSGSGNTYQDFHSGPANPTPPGFVGKTPDPVAEMKRWGLPTR